MKKTLSLLLALLLLVAFALSLVGCGSTRREDPTQTVDITPKAGVSSGTLDFAIRLYRAAYDGNNTLLSPLSVLAALAMTANGAAGETKAQMESVLGATVEELNAFFDAYLANLPNDETCKLALADALWIREDYEPKVRRAYLDALSGVYRADVFSAPFNGETVGQINAWTNEKTDGMIPEIINNLERDETLLLLNALAFDAEWRSPYPEDQVYPGTFTKSDGTETDAVFLSDYEHVFLSDGDRATGFVKYYADVRYAFVALLPNEGISLEYYLATLSGKRLASILEGKRTDVVFKTRIPKFEVRSQTDTLRDELQELGMTDAFQPGADFSGVSDEGFAVSRILHKTYLSVGEKGTRGGAATAVGLMGGVPEYLPVPVILDRPFVYLIYDVENNIPLFIGALNDPNG